MSVPHTKPKNKRFTPSVPTKAVGPQENKEPIAFPPEQVLIIRRKNVGQYISEEEFYEALGDTARARRYEDTFEKAELALYFAARNNHVSSIEDILRRDNGLTVDMIWGPTKQSLCQVALGWRAWEALELLLRRSPDIDYAKHGNETLLTAAIKLHSIGLVRKLLDKGANPNFINAGGLHTIFSIERGIGSEREEANCQLIEALLDAGADFKLFITPEHSFFKQAVDARIRRVPELLIERTQDPEILNFFLQDIEALSQKLSAAPHMETYAGLKSILVAKQEKMLLSSAISVVQSNLTDKEAAPPSPAAFKI